MVESMCELEIKWDRCTDRGYHGSCFPSNGKAVVKAVKHLFSFSDDLFLLVCIVWGAESEKRAKWKQMGNCMVTLPQCHSGLEFKILEKVGWVIVPYTHLAFKMKFSKKVQQTALFPIAWPGLLNIHMKLLDIESHHWSIQVSAIYNSLEANHQGLWERSFTSPTTGSF